MSVASHLGEDEPTPVPEELLEGMPWPRLDYGAFVKLMSSREVGEFKSPDQELRAVFSSMDANGDGVISRDEVLQAMESVLLNLPDKAQNSEEARERWTQEVLLAFDASDRNKSGSLDYAEFVAVLSGAAYTYDAELEGGGE